MAILLAGGLALSACGGENNGSGGSSGSGGSDDGIFSMKATAPEKPLVPGDTTEQGGSEFIDQLFTGLITYNVENNSAEYNGVAESITTEDQGKTFTVKLKQDWTFHDGTPVNADSFIKAWNYTASAKNGFGGAYFFNNIEGYKEVNPPKPEGEEKAPPQTAETLSGLKKVDDFTFTVTLADPFTQFPLAVGYAAFFPLPEAFYDDPKAFGKKPIGNGPWKAKTELDTNVGMEFEPFEGYKGTKPQAKGLKMVVYTDDNTAYNEVEGGSLDITPVPIGVIEEAPTTFGDRFLSRPSSSFAYVGFPTYDPRYQDKRVRQGLSLAFDRKLVTDSVFNGAMTPAAGVIPPVIEGHRADACKYCKLDKEAATKLLDEAGFDRSKKLELWFNAGHGHDAWVQAIGNQIKQNVGVDFTLNGDLQFAQYLPKIDAKGMTGPFRLGWNMDYPSMQNYLEPLFSEAALPPNGSNGTFFLNKDFDAKVKEANKTVDNAAAIKLYQEAEDILLEEMPIMPVYFGKSMRVHTERVSGVKIDGFGRIVTTDVKVG